MNSIKKYKNASNDSKLMLGIAIIVVLVLSYPLINSKLIAPNDGPYHLLRIEAIKDGLLSGNFPVKIYPSFMNGYGYGSGLFYPDLFLYIPAILRAIGFGSQLSYKIFLIMCILITYIGTYITGKSISKSKYVGTCAAILYCTSQYYLHNLFVRTALGEIQAYMFFPLVVLGVYNLVFEEFDKPYIIGIGFWGLMFSHTISLVMALIVVFFIVLFNYKQVFKRPKKVRNLIITALIVLLASLWFWLPLLEQLFTGEFGFNNPWTTVSQNSLDLIQLFKQTGNGIGSIIIILCFFRLNISKKNENINDINKIDWFLIIGTICMIMTTKLFPWKVVEPLLNHIQFPWRFLAIASLFLSISIALMYNIIVVKEFKKITILIILAISSYSVIGFYNNCNIEYSLVDMDNNYYNNKDNTFDIGAGEWIPSGTIFETELFENPRIITNFAEEIKFLKSGNRIIFDYLDNQKYDYCDIPMLYYKGYTAKLIDSNGFKTELNVSGEGLNGNIRVEMPEGKTGEVIVDYTGTIIQKISYLISCIVYITLTVYLIKKIGFKLLN